LGVKHPPNDVPIYTLFTKIMKIYFRLSCVWLCCIGFSHCQAADPRQATRPPVSQQPVKTLPPPYKSLAAWDSVRVGAHWVDIRSPEGKPKGDILVLPGWNFPRRDWCEKSSLCTQALAAGYRLVMPEMGRSIYATQHYAETRKDWQVYPTKTWVCDTLVPFLQKEYGIFTDQQPNYVLGLSTGGRGVALLCLAMPQLFQAAAALSGDFEPLRMLDDNLMNGFYGSYAQFPDRWEGEENPNRQAKKFQTPLYLGHGRQDDIVPFEQTEIFYNTLQKENPDLWVEFHPTDAKHDYVYWDSEVGNMLAFFEKVRQKRKK